MCFFGQTIFFFLKWHILLVSSTDRCTQGLLVVLLSWTQIITLLIVFCTDMKGEFRDTKQDLPFEIFLGEERDIVLKAFLCILKLSNPGEVIVIYWLSISATSNCLFDSAALCLLKYSLGKLFPKENFFFSSEKTSKGNKDSPYFPGMYHIAINILSLSNHLAPIFECYSVYKALF